MGWGEGLGQRLLQTVFFFNHTLTHADCSHQEEGEDTVSETEGEDVGDSCCCCCTTSLGTEHGGDGGGGGGAALTDKSGAAAAAVPLAANNQLQPSSFPLAE